METTEKNYVVNFEDAYASCIMLSVDFTLNGVNYEARADLLYGDLIENIEVLNVDTDEFIYDDDDEAWVLGDYLLFNMNIGKNLTF